MLPHDRLPRVDHHCGEVPPLSSLALPTFPLYEVEVQSLHSCVTMAPSDVVPVHT